MIAQEQIEKFIADMISMDHTVRDQAHYGLVEAGHDAVPYLIDVLKNDTPHRRWKAAKILADIQDPTSADALVEALQDASIEVHWAASEALIRLGKDAILPLLEGIVHNFASQQFLSGAYHILHTFEASHMLDSDTQEVLDSLRDVGASTKAPWAAERAIEKLTLSNA